MNAKRPKESRGQQQNDRARPLGEVQSGYAFHLGGLLVRLYGSAEIGLENDANAPESRNWIARHESRRRILKYSAESAIIELIENRLRSVRRDGPEC